MFLSFQIPLKKGIRNEISIYIYLHASKFFIDLKIQKPFFYIPGPPWSQALRVLVGFSLPSPSVSSAASAGGVSFGGTGVSFGGSVTRVGANSLSSGFSTTASGVGVVSTCSIPSPAALTGVATGCCCSFSSWKGWTQRMGNIFKHLYIYIYSWSYVDLVMFKLEYLVIFTKWCHQRK